MMADQVLVLQNGQVREYGETDEVLDSSDRSIYKETDEFGASSETCRHQEIRRK